jgi:hypothetical protein
MAMAGAARSGTNSAAAHRDVSEVEEIVFVPWTASIERLQISSAREVGLRAAATKACALLDFYGRRRG